MAEGRKRRKWDVAAPEGIPTAPFAAVRPGVPLDEETRARARQGAAAIVAKINQELLAQGKVPSGMHVLMPGGRSAGDRQDVDKDVSINDAPPDTRHFLTRRPTQDDIGRRTGTVLTVRGRYYPPGVPREERDPPLLLHIAPGASHLEDDPVRQRSVEAAAAEVHAILQGARPPRGSGPTYRAPGALAAAANARPPDLPAGGLAGAGAPPRPSVAGVPPPSYNGGAPAAGPLTITVPVGIEAGPEFGLAARLRGPEGSFLAHISRETGAAVALRGRGAGGADEGPAPLHVAVAAPSAKAAESARGLAQSLIDTVRRDAAAQAPAQMRAQAQPQASAPAQSQGAPRPAVGGDASMGAEEQRRKRFREFKEEPRQAPVNPYAQPPPDAAALGPMMGPAPRPAADPNLMGPPAPKVMAAPPPRAPQGNGMVPPPPRVPQGGGAVRLASDGANPLNSLLGAYTDDE
ncbi:hypothetical protein WJX81_007444 [Elliptochloris bilobata]|uniref:K Homology domain-containing protein n=1 Tax=Elliptochloris bilobata TaxID=381761 RepID=A0AAW1RVS9_9CHLO